MGEKINYVDKMFEKNRQSAIDGNAGRDPGLQELYTSEEGRFPGFEAPVLTKTDGPLSANFSDSFKAGTQVNPKDAITMLSKSMGISKDRFLMFSDGTIGYKDDDGKYYPAIGNKFGYYTPDVSQLAVDAIGSGVLSANPFSIATVPAFNMGTEVVRQEIAEEFRDEEGEYDNFRIGVSGLGGFAGEGIASVIKKVKTGKLAKDFSELSDSDLQLILKDAKDLKIDLTLPEASALKSQLMDQEIVGGLPETASKMDKFYESRRIQVDKAIEKYLKNLSPSDDAIESGMLAKESINKHILKMQNVRSNTTKPLYKKAIDFANDNMSDWDYKIMELAEDIKLMYKKLPVNSQSKKVLMDLEDSLYKRGDDTIIGFDGKAGDKITQDGFYETIDDAEMVQNIISDISTKLKNARTPGNYLEGVDAKVAKNYSDIQKRLKNVIGEDNPFYKEADAAYKELSTPIDKFKNNKMAATLKVRDGEEYKIAQQIFKDGDTASIKYAKSILSPDDGGVPSQEWTRLVKSYLNESFEKVKKQSRGQKGMDYDAGMKFKNQIFGDPKTKRALKAALSKDQYESLTKLANVLDRTGLADKGNSKTAFRQQGIQNMSEGVATKIADTAQLNIFTSVQRSIRQWTLSSNANQFVDIILDPTNAKKIASLNKQTNLNKAGYASLLNLLTQGSQEYIDGPSVSKTQLDMIKEQSKPKVDYVDKMFTRE